MPALRELEEGEEIGILEETEADKKNEILDTSVTEETVITSNVHDIIEEARDEKKGDDTWI
jgi:hypothetical protein